MAANTELRLKLKDSEDRFRNLIEGSIQGILIHRNWTPLFVNRAYAAILGYDSPEELMTLGSVENHLAPYERERRRRYMEARMRGEPAPSQYEFDAVRKHGGKPANYCEIGGNPSVSKACALTKLILSKPGVEKIAVMMNVVSNTRVDMVARGVVKGCIESGRDPKDAITIFRIPGAWEDEGFKILRKYGVDYCDRSVSMYEAAGRAVEKLGAAS